MKKTRSRKSRGTVPLMWGEGGVVQRKADEDTYDGREKMFINIMQL